MINPKCIIEVGIHPGPYWRDKSRGNDFIVCSRHRSQYEERAEEFGPFDWEEVVPVSDKVGKHCKRCSTTESPRWWKCCSEHTTEQGTDVVCEKCADQCSMSKNVIKYDFVRRMS